MITGDLYPEPRRKRTTHRAMTRFRPHLAWKWEALLEINRRPLKTNRPPKIHSRPSEMTRGRSEDDPSSTGSDKKHMARVRKKNLIPKKPRPHPTNQDRVEGNGRGGDRIEPRGTMLKQAPRLYRVTSSFKSRLYPPPLIFPGN